MTQRPLHEVAHLVADELKEFESRYYDFLRSRITVIDQAVRFLLRRRGKMVRPMITFLAARLLGEVNDNTHKAAIIVELMHNATLVHDDIVDEADRRRGLPTLHKIFGNKIAVLLGDYLLANSLMGMLELRDFKVFEVLSHCSKRMAQGELVQASRIKKLDITEEIYLHMIADKTAALISAACQLGGVTAGADEEQLQALARFGELWGMAFQIEDDILDYEGDPRLFGKPVGSDLQEKKITLPLIYTLERMTPARRALTRLRVRLGTRRQIRRVLESVREADGLGYARKVASGLVEQAVANLEVFPPSPLREALSAYARDTLTRKY